MVNEHVLPRVRGLEVTTSELATTVRSACQAKNPGRNEDVTGKFAAAVRAWASVSHLNFGPLAVEARRERMAFLPDPRGIVRRQLVRLSRSGSFEKITAKSITEHSVAVQGLTALDQIPFIQKERIRNDIREGRIIVEWPFLRTPVNCPLAVAITANTAAIARDLRAEWTNEKGWRTRLLSAGPDDPIYRSTEEAAAELVKALTTALDGINKHQILPLQNSSQYQRPARGVPFFKTELSRVYLIASIDAAIDLYEKLNLEPYVIKKKPWLKTWLPETISSLRENSAKITYPVWPVHVFAKENYDHIRNLERFTRGLSKVVATELGPAAGLTVGFNQVDGD